MTTFEIEAPAPPSTPEVGYRARVRLEMGVFPQACELCGATPTVLAVRRSDVDIEALLKVGDGTFVESYFYCPQHRGAAAALYEDFWDRG